MGDIVIILPGKDERDFPPDIFGHVHSLHPQIGNIPATTIESRVTNNSNFYCYFSTSVISCHNYHTSAFFALLSLTRQISSACPCLFICWMVNNNYIWQVLVTNLIPPSSISLPLFAKYLLFTIVIDVASIVNTVISLNWNYKTPRTDTMPRWVRTLCFKYLAGILMMRRPEDEDQPQQAPVYIYDWFHHLHR